MQKIHHEFILRQKHKKSRRIQMRLFTETISILITVTVPLPLLRITKIHFFFGPMTHAKFKNKKDHIQEIIFFKNQRIEKNQHL
jgi:hypothetical protein